MQSARKSTSRCLITRPIEDAKRSAEIAIDRGYEVICEPLMHIIYRPFPIPAVNSSLLFTSANGVRSFINTVHSRDFKVYAVGNATAHEASEAGFKNVYKANGSVDLLFKLILEIGDKNSSYYHICGEHARGNLAEDLRNQGYKAERMTAYTGSAVSEFSKTTLDAIRENKIDTVVFFSPRTVEIFVTLLRKHTLESQMNNMAFICVSNATAERLGGIEEKNIIIDPSWIGSN